MGNELIFEGKKYISAKRASQITGYNSDYIGQLCRKGSLECRLVGRSWFVEEKSLNEHEFLASKTPRGRIPNFVKAQAKKAVSEIAQNNSQKTESAMSPVSVSVSVNDTKVVVYPYDRNLPVLRAVENHEDKAFVRKVVGIFAAIIICVLGMPFVGGKNNTATVNVAIKTGTEIAMEINSSASKHIASAVSSLKNTGLVLAANNDSIHEFRIKTHQFTLKTYHVISMLPNMFFNTAHTMKTLVMRNGENTSGANEEVSTPGTRSGITVVPSTGDSSKDEKLKQYIKDSFSDETKVVPDETGKSGVIKPIFKKQSDQDYIYVIVPTKQ